MEIKLNWTELRKQKLFVATPMYGGMCTASYTRSMVDLASICTANGIQLQFYVLSNESLITRARAYACDEFLRSDATHLLFVDSDIGFTAQDVFAMLALNVTEPEKYNILAGPYPKKSVPSFTKILTEDGTKNISELVNSKYSGKVLSFNHTTNEMEWKNVINHFKNSNQNKWIGLKTKSNMGDLIVTYDHDCYVTDDILEPSVYKTEARNTVGKYLLVNPHVKSNANKVNSLYNREQLSFLVGTLFGDGCINNTGYLKFGHSNKQYDYLNLKTKLFGGKVSIEKKTGEYKGKEYFGKFLESPRNEQIRYLKDLFYVNGVKTIKNVINLLDEKGLAFWYMDDGSYDENYHNLKISSQSFDNEDHEIIKEYFNKKWGIEISIRHIVENNNNIIYIPRKEENKFFSLISQYIIPELEYKLPKEFRNGVKHLFNFDRLSYGAVEVLEIKTSGGKLSRAGRQYDITVEDNHNFIADDYVISNCLSWEKIIGAVKKGLGDKNPNDLEKFTGDYVFNPKNKSSIQISEPAEVLEAGTGFMMIPRATFDAFKAAYPEKSYLPDHIRTEQFDGSREIIMYFDCVIDKPIREKTYGQLLTAIANGDNISQAEIKKVIEDFDEAEKNSSKRYLSEDYYFCQNINKIGLKVWLLPWMKLTHTGTYTWVGSLADLAQAQVAATADPSALGKPSKEITKKSAPVARMKKRR